MTTKDTFMNLGQATSLAATRGLRLVSVAPGRFGAECAHELWPTEGYIVCCHCQGVWTERPDKPAETILEPPVDPEAETALYLRFQELEVAMRSTIPEGRSLAVALTKLEECAMWVAMADGNAKHGTPGMRAYGRLRVKP